MEWAALLGALWLGLLTAASPCPLAMNLAALSFLARHSAEPGRVLRGGLAYSLGRMFSYVLLSWLLISGALAVPAVSFFLQEHLPQWMGPLLVLTGAVLLDLLPLPSFGISGGEKWNRLASGGFLGAFALGAVFALAFCPVSAALFFAGFLPLAVKSGSRVLLPSVYGLGTGLPVAVLAVALALGLKQAAALFNRMTALEKVCRQATGWILVGLGIYLTIQHTFR